MFSMIKIKRVLLESIVEQMYKEMRGNDEEIKDMDRTHGKKIICCNLKWLEDQNIQVLI